MRATSASSKALPVSASASNARSVRNAAVAVAVLELTSVTATRAPSRAKKCAIVPPMFGPAPKTIATLSARRFISGTCSSADKRVAAALQRTLVAVLNYPPLFGRAPLAQRLHLAPENSTQQRDAHVGLAQALLCEVDNRALTHHGDIVLRRRELQGSILRPHLVEQQRVVV